MSNWAPASVSAADSDTEMETTRNNVPAVTVTEDASRNPADARSLVRQGLWGLRRYSDSFTERDPQFIFEASFLNVTAMGDATPGNNPTTERALIPSEPRPLVKATRRRPLRVEDSSMSAGSSMALDSINTNFNFMEWTKFYENVLPKKKSNAKPRHAGIINALNEMELKVSKVALKGVGGLISPVVGSFNVRFPLEEFVTQCERSLLLPRIIEPPLPKRDLEKLEKELFDTSRYEDGGNHLTVLTWDHDKLTGNITLFEVTVTPDQRGNPAQAVRIHPVAAMEGVPKNVLVNMRLDPNVRKTVIVRANKEFTWKTLDLPAPSYAKLKEDDSAAGMGRRRLLRVEREDDPKRADAHGLLATIPQLLGLLHTSRTVLELFRTTEADGVDLEGERSSVRGVTIKKGPRGNTFETLDVHVVVLQPKVAPWAEERIFWTSDDQLYDLRHRRYWTLVKGGSGRRRSKSPSDSPWRSSSRRASGSGSGSGSGRGSRSRTRSPPP